MLALFSYIYKDYFEYAFWESNQYSESLKRKVIIVDDIFPCMNDLAEGKHHICFKTEDYFTVFGNESVFPMTRVLIAKPVFNCLRTKFNFEKSSPYIKKFGEILRLFYESGIDQYLDQFDGCSIRFPQPDKEEENEGQFVTKLVLIFTCGNVVSVFIFIMEILLKEFNLRREEEKGKLLLRIYICTNM